MAHLLRPLFLVTIVLLIPIVPFVAFGARLEQEITAWLSPPPSNAWLAAAVAGILTTDIFLPIPSSFVSTLAGAKLGTLLGTFASWLGLTLGAMLGFALARLWGRPLAERFTHAEDLDRMDQMTARFGPMLVVLARAVPIFAEASVLLLGATGLPWRRFLPPLVVSNFGIALAYSAFGSWAEQYEFLPAALSISAALPLLIATALKHYTTPHPQDQ